MLATDADAGINGQVEYFFKQSNQYFAIGLTSGVVSTKRLLDTDAVKTHYIEVIAKDRGSKPLNATGESSHIFDKK